MPPVGAQVARQAGVKNRSRAGLVNAGYLRKQMMHVLLYNMRDLGPEKPQCLAGSLLVAHPNMLDPNFRRTVLFISAHDPEGGALGVIINKPLDKIVSDLVTEQPPDNLAEVPVFLAVRSATTN